MDSSRSMIANFLTCSHGLSSLFSASMSPAMSYAWRGGVLHEHGSSCDHFHQGGDSAPEDRQSAISPHR